ncbi:signal peptidase I [Anaerotignum sp.]|uniref:signal peptidase I n=1 Tax=Anaerotignum sp. TaxID=2039241 RepID=UPI00332B8DD3
MEQTQEQIEYEGKNRELVKKKKEFPLWVQLLLLLALVFVLRTFVLGTVYVKGSSMEPNFYHGDLVFINKLATSVASPQKGDVVICRLNSDGQEENIIKRVIGLPGDEIDIVWNGDSENVEYYLYVNDERIEESFLGEPMMTKGDIEYPFEVPEGSYFVMGDNRNASSDSRRVSIGAIEKKDLVGEVVFRLYPFDKFGFIS